MHQDHSLTCQFNGKRSLVIFIQEALVGVYLWFVEDEVHRGLLDRQQVIVFDLSVDPLYSTLVLLQTLWHHDLQNIISMWGPKILLCFVFGQRVSSRAVINSNHHDALEPPLVHGRHILRVDAIVDVVVIPGEQTV